MSRYHAELNEDKNEDGLRIKCFSSNGVLINQTVFLEKDKSYILGNSDTFSIGDASEDYQDPIQVIMFAVRSEIIDTEAPNGAKSKEQQQIAESTNGSHTEVDRKTVIGSSNACPRSASSGPRRQVGKCVNWAKASTGQIRQLGKCVNWANASTGQVRQLGKCVKWAKASTGPRRQLGECVNWASASSGPRGRVRSIEERIDQLP